MKAILRAIFLSTVCLAIFIPAARAAEPPHITMENGAAQLIVNGQPFLILGGELGNSSAGTAAEADVIIPKVAGMHVNTVLMPVAWEQIEPKEGSLRQPSIRGADAPRSRKGLGAADRAHGAGRKRSRLSRHWRSRSLAGSESTLSRSRARSIDALTHDSAPSGFAGTGIAY